jgi:hypothetical protein
MRSSNFASIIVLGALGMLCLTGCANKAATNPQATSTLVPPSAAAPAPLGESRFVTKWLVLGPITFAAGDYGGDQQQAATEHVFIGEEFALDGTRAPKGMKWQAKDFKGGEGKIDLDALYNQADHAAAYAVAWVECPQDIPDAKLLVGSDDYLKVWINGKLVHTFKTERRAGEADQDVVSQIHMKKGLNRIVVKCVDVVLDWNFFLRFATTDSKAIGVK